MRLWVCYWTWLRCPLYNAYICQTTTLELSALHRGHTGAKSVELGLQTARCAKGRCRPGPGVSSPGRTGVRFSMEAASGWLSSGSAWHLKSSLRMSLHLQRGSREWEVFWAPEQIPVSFQLLMWTLVFKEREPFTLSFEIILVSCSMAECHVTNNFPLLVLIVWQSEHVLGR